MGTGWFQRATAALNRAEPIPQRYEVSCDCGARLTGVRVPAPQKPSCPDCGNIVFILPATVYPIPPSVQRRWLGTETPELVASFPKSKKFQSVSEQRREKERARKAKAELAITQPKRELGPPLSERLRKQITPLRLMVVTIMTGVMLTGWVLIRNARWDRAQRELQGALDRGHAALDEGDLTVAASEFQMAAKSLDILGRQDDVASQIRRAANETAAASQLSPVSLVESLEAWLLKPAAQGSAAAWNSEAWYLFDAELRPATAAEFAGGSSPLVLDLPLMVGKTPVLLLIEEPEWKSWLTSQSANGSQRVLFAAQLRRGEIPKGDRGVARVWLNDVTAVLWSDTDTFPDAGLLVDESENETKALIASQREYLESRP